MTILLLYLSYVLPLAFLMLVIKGESKGIIISSACGMTITLTVYGITGFIAEEFIPLTIQLCYVIPVLEEILKGLPLLFMIRGLNRTYKYALVKYAFAIGLSFSILENNLYVMMDISAGESSPVVFIIMRSLTSSLLHGSTTALVGYGLQQGLNLSVFSLPLVLGCWFSGMVFHSLYNNLWLSGANGMMAAVLPIAIFIFVTFSINIFGLPLGKKKNSGVMDPA